MKLEVILWIVRTMVLSSLLLVASRSAYGDDIDVWEEIQGLKDRIATLEKARAVPSQPAEISARFRGSFPENFSLLAPINLANELQTLSGNQAIPSE